MTALEVRSQADLVLSYYTNIDAGGVPTALACLGHRIEAVLDSGDEVAVRGSFEGTFRDGSPLRARWGDTWRFGDGKVVERNSCFDAPVA